MCDLRLNTYRSQGMSTYHRLQTSDVQRPKYCLTWWKRYILTACAVSKSSAALHNELTRSNSATPFCGEHPLHHPTIRDVERSSSQLLAIAMGNALVNKHWVEHTMPSSWHWGHCIGSFGLPSIWNFLLGFKAVCFWIHRPILSYYIV